MRLTGRTALVVFCGLLALAIVAGGGVAQKAFAHGDRGGKCDCCRDRSDCCKDKEDCTECGHGHGMSGMPPMMEGMKSHVAEVKKSVEALRASEKKLEGITDPKAFRAAVIEHLKRVDDLQESHLKHMESMPGRMMKGEKAQKEPCAKPCDKPCDQPCDQPCDEPCPQEKPPAPAAK